MPATLPARGTLRRGRPATRWWDAHEIAALCELPSKFIEGLLRRRLSFFCHAKIKTRDCDQQDVWMAPDRDVALFLKMPRPHPCVSAATAAAYLEVSTAEVHRLRKRGSLPFRMVGNRLRFPVSALNGEITKPAPGFLFSLKRGCMS